MPKIMIQNNSNVAIHNLKPGASMKVEADAEGNPLDFHLRRRLRDSKIDGAITVVPEKHKPKKASKVVDEMEG